MAIDINSAKSTFFADTGLEWSANLHAFIQYYQARIMEQMMITQEAQMKELIQKVDNLDDNIKE